MTERCLAIIPARGGSKGLPGKNTRMLHGLPLLVHSIRCASMADGVTRTIVSTDSEGVASVALEYGGEVPFMRPAELAADDTPMMPVIQHAVAEIEHQEGNAYETVLLLDPTSPCRLPIDIEQALAMLMADQSADGVVACSEPDFNPFWVGVVRGLSGQIVPIYGEDAGHGRRQDVPAFYRINGALYLWRRGFVDRRTTSTSGRQLMLEIPESRAFSVDSLAEFERMEALLHSNLLEFPWLESPLREDHR